MKDSKEINNEHNDKINKEENKSGKVFIDFVDNSKTIEATSTSSYESKYALQIEALDKHAIVSIANRAGIITYVNDKFCEISGYSREELVGKRHQIIKSNYHSKLFFKEMWKTISSGATWNGEICNKKKDGSLYWVETTIVPKIDVDGKTIQYLSIRTEITKLKELEARLTKQNEAQKILSDFASSLIKAQKNEFDKIIKNYSNLLCKKLEVNGADIFFSFQKDKLELYHRVNDELIEGESRFISIDLNDIPELREKLKQESFIYVNNDFSIKENINNEIRKYLFLDTCSFLIKSLKKENETLGLVSFYSNRNNFEEYEIELLSFFCNIIVNTLERIKSETPLIECETNYKSLVNNLPGMVYSYRIESGISHISNSFKICGYTDNELLINGKNALLSLVHPDDVDNYLSDFDSLKSIKHSVTGEYRIIHKNGTIHWVKEFKKMLFEDEILIGFDGVIFDNTETKKLEILNELNKERLRRGQVYANIGTWEWDIVTNELYWTERVGPLFGYPENNSMDIEFDKFLNVIHADDKDAVMNAIRDSVEHNQPYNIEHRVVWADGTIKWVQEKGAVIRDENDKPIKMIGVVQDIHDKKLAELALAERENDLKFAQSIAKIGNWSIDFSDGSVDWSDEVYNLLNMKKVDNPAHFGLLKDILLEEDFRLIGKKLIEAEKTGQFNVTHRVVLKNNTIRYFQEIAHAELDSTGKVSKLVGTVQDVTERVESENALIAAKDEATKANFAKSEFLSSMSHELRTPMNSIIGFSQLLEYDEKLTSEQKANIREIRKAGKHLLELINQVLDLSKIESGNNDMILEPVLINDVIQESITLVKTLAFKKSVKIQFINEAQFIVKADRLRLKQVVLNLLSNAIKYNKINGEVRITLEKKVSEKQAKILLVVADKGIGIPSNQLNELFLPFQRLGLENKEVEGTGIGLSITKRIVELMNGSIGVLSKENEGSTFWVELDVLESEKASRIQTDQKEEEIVKNNPSQINKPNEVYVVYIEDNLSNIKLMTQIFDYLPGAKLVTSTKPLDGLKIISEIKPELILLDINLPEMNGFEVLKRIRKMEEFESIPVLAITANAMENDVKKGMDLGFSYYITKPIDINKFMKIINDYLLK